MLSYSFYFNKFNHLHHHHHRYHHPCKHYMDLNIVIHLFVYCNNCNHQYRADLLMYMGMCCWHMQSIHSHIQCHSSVLELPLSGSSFWLNSSIRTNFVPEFNRIRQVNNANIGFTPNVELKQCLQEM